MKNTPLAMGAEPQILSGDKRGPLGTGSESLKDKIQRAGEDLVLVFHSTACPPCHDVKFECSGFCRFIDDLKSSPSIYIVCPLYLVVQIFPTELSAFWRNDKKKDHRRIRKGSKSETIEQKKSEGVGDGTAPKEEPEASGEGTASIGVEL